MLRKILFSLVLLFSINISAETDTIRASFKEVFTIIKQHCKADQYFFPDNSALSLMDLPDTILGQCSTDRINYWEITMDRHFWENYSETNKFGVMAHEVMHCMFFKEHVDNPHNYMYYNLVRQTKKEITQQLIADLKEKCEGKK